MTFLTQTLFLLLLNFNNYRNNQTMECQKHIAINYPFSKQTSENDFKTLINIIPFFSYYHFTFKSV